MREKTAHYGTLRETDTASMGVIPEEGNHDVNGRNRQPVGQDMRDGNAVNVSKTYSADSRSSWRKLVARGKENALLLALVASLILGVVLGCVLRLLPATPLTEEQQVYLQFPGEILMNMLKLLILPLIVSSLISGMTTLDKSASGRMIVQAVCYYLSSMLLAVILGIILVVSIRPGDRTGVSHTIKEEVQDSHVRPVDTSDTFLDLIRQLFPDNLIQACFSKKVTRLTLVDDDKNNETHAGVKYKRTMVQEDGINMLGLIVFSLALGAAINHMGEGGRPLKLFVEALANATLLIVNAVIWYSPFGILFLVAAQIVGLEDAKKSLEQLGLYMVTVVLGLFVHGFAVLPLVYFILVQKNPYSFMRGILQAMVTAFGTSSSSATIPVTMRNLEENNGVDPRVISFVIPVGATINMDGTALYEAVATIFIGQINGLDLSFGKVITICITATAAAIGAAGVPQAGLVTMVIVLESVGFPTSGIALILAVDWILDRLRTAVNVLGDAYGAGIVNHYSKSSWVISNSTDQIPLTPEQPKKPGPELDHLGRPIASTDLTHQTSFYQR